MNKNERRKHIIYECVMPFLIPILFIVISYLRKDTVEISTYTLLIMTSSFSVFVSYIYIINDRYELVMQPTFVWLSIVGIVFTVLFDSFKMKIDNLNAFVISTIILVGLSIFYIVSETRRSYDDFLKNKEFMEHKDCELKNRESVISNLTLKIKDYEKSFKDLEAIDELFDDEDDLKKEIKDIVKPRTIETTDKNYTYVNGKRLKI